MIAPARIVNIIVNDLGIDRLNLCEIKLPRPENTKTAKSVIATEKTGPPTNTEYICTTPISTVMNPNPNAPK